MIESIRKLFRSKPVETAVTPVKRERVRQIFSTHDLEGFDMSLALEKLNTRIFSNAVRPELQLALDAAHKSPKATFAMDNVPNIKSSFYGNDLVPQGVLLWFANQSFIGYQLCAMFAQQWLVSKCCWMPAEDAVRNGYKITVNDGSDVGPDILDDMRKLDVEYRLTENLKQFVGFGRVFGIRVAMFKVESDDPGYYFKPFNPDGITPGSYKGISQIDPYWVTPQLDPESAGDPASIHFYEPTWWNIAGKLVHRTHLIIYRTEEVADILKPSYIYGGIPIPQKIYERVYAAERTANEAPMLALTKRLDVLKCDLTQALAQEISFAERLQRFTALRDNFGVKAIGLEEEMEQFDTTLADLDAVIMTQYQLVAAAANVPATKLLGTTPKGFSATGEYEEANYHEMLESLQNQALTPLIERHHLLLIRSEIIPKHGGEVFETAVEWEPLDAMTAKEKAEINKMKAETGAVLMGSGAIDGTDERERVIKDPESGYTGLPDDVEPIEEVLSEPDGGKP